MMCDFNHWSDGSIGIRLQLFSEEPIEQYLMRSNSDQDTQPNRTFCIPSLILK